MHGCLNCGEAPRDNRRPLGWAGEICQGAVPLVQQFPRMRILVDIQGIEAVGASWTEQHTRRLDALRREAAEAREQHRVVLLRGTALGALVQQRPEDARGLFGDA